MDAKRYKKSVFIFRRDLRLEDNTALIAALEQSEQVLPLFIFDVAQVEKKKNAYFSHPAFQFMLASLEELQDAIKKHNGTLYAYQGVYSDVLDDILAHNSIDAVFVNKDYTPFAKKRDAKLASVCKKHGIQFKQFDDYTLSPIASIRTDQGDVYKVFTPFMRKAVTHEVPVPQLRFKGKFVQRTPKTTQYQPKRFKLTVNKNAILSGGRAEALRLLKDVSFLKSYTTNRNIPSIKGTSLLSAHHKFGTISIRETYHAVRHVSGASEQFLAELYWRDFYMYIALHFPHVFGKSFQAWGDRIKWVNNKKQFTTWCNGATGVPIVDAGMRQLNETGWMHNRVRMIVASYLTKNLLIDWRWGERYFASTLIDYDPCSNNGGWQWSASVGADPKPIRIFNPYLQAREYDPEAIYMMQWVPELQSVDPALLAGGKEVDFSTLVPNYPPPLIAQKESYHRAREVYKQAKAF
jgi:deoxyribodipyrimidine photo-lyase